MSWQKCPICEGDGIDPYVTVSFNIPTSLSDPCPKCKGFRVISELTGEPPEHNIGLANNNINDISIDRINTSGDRSMYKTKFYSTS